MGQGARSWAMPRAVGDVEGRLIRRPRLGAVKWGRVQAGAVLQAIMMHLGQSPGLREH